MIGAFSQAFAFTSFFGGSPSADVVVTGLTSGHPHLELVDVSD